MGLSYQSKLVALISSVFISITVCLYYVLTLSLSENNLRNIEKQLSFTSTLIDDQLLDKTEDIIYYSTQSSSITQFSAQAPTLNQERMLLRLHELANEFRSDRALLITKSLAIKSDTYIQKDSPQNFPYPDIRDHLESNSAFQIVLPMNDVIYHWVIFPIQSHNEILWLAFGNEIDKIFKHDLDNISPLNINLSFAYEMPENHWRYPKETFRLLGTEFEHGIQKYLHHIDEKNATQLSIRQGNQVVFMLPLIQSQNSPKIVAILIYSFSESFKPYLTIIYKVIGLFLAAFALMVTGLILINRKYKIALSKIVNFVEKLNEGDYQQRLPYHGKGVISQLSTLLNNMINKIHLREKELLHKTRYDPITELPNKSFFIEQLTKILQAHQAKQLAVVLVTIHRFPQINHALGHRVADRLLHHVGARIVGAFEDASFVGKLSGNVFAMILTDVMPSDAENISNRILDLFENPFSVYTVTIDLNAHVGFSFYPEDGDESDILIQKSDVALFKSQSNAEHFAIYDASSDPHQFNKLSLMSELKEGLQHDEFLVYYQPKVDLKTDRIIQVEALVRWMHPYKGFMSPNLFIPLAEETGHIKKITAWLLNQTFEQCALWEKTNIPLQISVNLSVKDLLNRKLIKYINGLLEVHAINPNNIIFEITESAFMQDPENSLDAIKKMRTLGFSFTIDDFGTGYSSMSYLKNLPVDELKIDQTFIRDIAHNSKDAQIVRTTIELGHGLGLAVVAEGIEDEAAYELLKSFDCDIGQGYYMGKPVALNELEEWLKTSRWGLPTISQK